MKIKKDVNPSKCAESIRIPLSETSANHFRSQRNLNLLYIYHSSKINKNPTAWRRAFDHVVKHCPQLQLTIDDEDATNNNDTLYLVRNHFPDRLPKINVEVSPAYPDAKDEVEVLWKRGEELRNKILAAMDSLKSKSYEKTPSLVMVVLLGRKSVVQFSFMPHYLADGMGIATATTLVAIYARVPRTFWFLLDRMIPNYDHPSDLEMALKGDFEHILAKYEGSVSNIPQISGPSPEDYFSFTPSSEKKFGFKQCWQVPKEAVEVLKKRLRQDHDLPFSVSFTAIASKVALTILDRHDPTFSSQGDFYATVPFDMRTLGKWNDKRRHRRTQFPIVGDYARSLFVPIKAEMLLAQPIANTAKVVASEVARLKTDSEFRARYVSSPSTTSNLLAGVSSVRGSKAAPKFMKNLEAETAADIETLNRVWMVVVEPREDSPSVFFSIDVALSLEGLDEEKAKNAVRDVVCDTIFADCFRPML